MGPTGGRTSKSNKKQEKSENETESLLDQGSSQQGDKAYVKYLGKLYDYYKSEVRHLGIIEAMEVFESKIKLHEKELSDGLVWKYVFTHINETLELGEKSCLDTATIQECLKKMATLFCRASQNREKLQSEWLYAHIHFGLKKILEKINLESEEGICNHNAVQELQKQFEDYFNLTEYEPYHEPHKGKWKRFHFQKNNKRCEYFLEKINVAEESMGLQKSWIEDLEKFTIPNPYQIPVEEESAKEGGEIMEGADVPDVDVIDDNDSSRKKREEKSDIGVKQHGVAKSSHAPSDWQIHMISREKGPSTLDLLSSETDEPMSSWFVREGIYGVAQLGSMKPKIKFCVPKRLLSHMKKLMGCETEWEGYEISFLDLEDLDLYYNTMGSLLFFYFY